MPLCRSGRKQKASRKKGATGHDPSLLHGKGASGTKSWKASPESKPLLLQSRSQGSEGDAAEFSDYMNSDTCSD